MNHDLEKVEFKVIPYGGKEWHEALILKENILRKPLGQIFSNEEKKQEEKHINVVGILNQQIIATALLVAEQSKCKMQRVTIAASLQNQGIGKNLLAYCEELISNQSFHLMYCHARDTAVNFYTQNGYQKEGDYFDEDGIPHLKMTKKIS
ncbi:MAG: GNAT family N-acetyltransferase [Schleiferiaceae bacterium]|nr:GNAT family N-acetyltransferase [Schleiferiaceae bacterium]